MWPTAQAVGSGNAEEKCATGVAGEKSGLFGRDYVAPAKAGDVFPILFFPTTFAMGHMMSPAEAGFRPSPGLNLRLMSEGEGS
jgi:hypothetical protein